MRFLVLTVLVTLSSGCEPASKFVQCPPDTYADGMGPPFGKRVVCLSRVELSEAERPQRHGPELRWFGGGTMRSKQTYVRDELSGRSQTWFSNGKPSKDGAYEDDLRVGLWTEWAYEGHLRSKSTYRAGRLHGVRSFFYPGGQLKSEHSYYEGVLHGPAKAFHSNGALKYSGRYGHNVRQGWWRTENPEGMEIESAYFVDGKVSAAPTR